MSDTDTEPVSFGDAVAALAAAEPDRPMITCGDRMVTRREFHERTNRLARAYAELGVGLGSYVTIALPNSIEFMESAFAAWKLGATPQPVSSRLPGRELAAILDLVKPSLVVGAPADQLGSHTGVPQGFEPPEHTSADDLPRAVAPVWKAPTSGGSTGRPKVILATQPGVLDSVAPFVMIMGLPERGTVLATGPFFHNGPFMSSAIGMLFGAHVVVMPRFDAQEALDLIERHQVNWMYAVPTMMLRIWRLPEADRLKPDLSSLERILHMAAPCPPWLKTAWIDWIGGDRVWELYAGTEVQAVTLISGTEWLAHPGSVGKTLIGEITVLDDDGKPAPAGTIGTLWMRRGEDQPPTYHYVGADAKSIDGGWESLGDVGRMDEEGYIYLTDRDSDMILVGGSNVYPAEVEAALEEHPAVRTSCVVGVANEDLGNVVHALVELDEDVTDEELIGFCSERLVRYKVPRVIHRSSTPLRDDAGKVRRTAVRDDLVARLG